MEKCLTQLYKSNPDDRRTWAIAWNKAGRGESRSNTEHMHSRVVEMIIRCNENYPIWSGIITITWTWCLRWAGIPEQQQIKVTKKFRQLLIEHATQMREARRTAIENEPVQHSNTDIVPSIVPQRKRRKRQRTIFDYLGGARTQNKRAKLNPPSPILTTGVSTQPLISDVLPVAPLTVVRRPPKSAESTKITTPTLAEFAKHTLRKQQKRKTMEKRNSKQKQRRQNKTTNQPKQAKHKMKTTNLTATREENHQVKMPERTGKIARLQLEDV